MPDGDWNASGRRRPGSRHPSPYARLSTSMPVTFGQRSTDRVTLAAGFVLGVGALLGVQMIWRMLTTIRDVLRPWSRW